MLPRPQPREAFRRELRGRLMAEARVALAPRETAWTTLRRTWLRPALALGMITVVLLGGGGLAAAGSLPGDPAFALKRAAEDVRLALASDDNARIVQLAAQADHRLAELTTAATTRPAAAPTASAAYAEAVVKLTTAIEALRAKPDAGATTSGEARDVADRAGTKHLDVLDELEQRVPEQERGAIEQAKNEAEKLRPSDDHRPAAAPGASSTKAPESPDPTGSTERTPSHSATETPEPRQTDGDEDARTPAPTARPAETRRPTPSPSPSPTEHR